MNRKLKFRYWDAKINKISEWIPGVSLNDKDLIIMQYTGLDDTDGISIFEGDIIDSCYEFDYEEPYGGQGYAWDDFNGVVEWNDNCASFYIRSPMLRSGKKYFNEINLKRTNVIGNIFENPELLK